MTAHRDFKQFIRARMAKTGESYTAARTQVLNVPREFAVDDVPSPAAPSRTTVDAVVYKVNDASARVRILGENEQVTFRASSVYRFAPGHIATLRVARRWTFRGYAYASGTVEDARIDIQKLGLTPLPLEDTGLHDVAHSYEPYRRPDPYAPMWRRLTRKPRRGFDMHPIAWDAVAHGTEDVDVAPVCEASELAQAGDVVGARDLLMSVLGEDLRCIDAHAHLGNLVFDHSPREALVHYEIGMRIGELSLVPGFDGLLLWGRIWNRPFLRCLHGYGLCLWRLGRLLEAQQVFERIVAFNPPDNQGVRFNLEDLRRGQSWTEASSSESATLH